MLGRQAASGQGLCGFRDRFSDPSLDPGRPARVILVMLDGVGAGRCRGLAAIRRHLPPRESRTPRSLHQICG